MMLHSSRIELSESALRRNLRFLRGVIGEGTRFVSVIKGNAYGHGIRTFVPLAERCGVRHFAVSSAAEALLAFESRTADSTIMIMGYVGNEALEWAVGNGVSFYVFDLGRLDAALRTARDLDRPARVHLELETGLNRTGLADTDLDAALDLVLSNPAHLRVEGVCTHFAGAESMANSFRIQAQQQRFAVLSDRIRGRGVSCGLRHTACSAAAITYPDAVMDMVRIGIAQYGFWPSTETRMQYMVRQMDAHGSARPADPLRRVMRWSSSIMSVKDVGPGDYVGYGTSFLTTRRQRVAAVPVGYFHGFARTMSNLGHVLIRGRRAPVAGTVNMNMTMVDVTDIPDARKGDEVVLIGNQRKAQITVSSFSDMTRFLNYEVLVRLPSEIPRIIVK